MALRQRRRADQGTKAQPRAEPRTSSKQWPIADRSLRAVILETPEREQDILLEALATEFPDLVPTADPAVSSAAAEDEAEDEEEGVELLGEGGEDYDLDPDGDLSESPAPEDSLDEAESARPDLVITEARIDGRRRFEVQLSADVPAWAVVARSTRQPRQAQRVLDHLRERRLRLWQLGQLIVEDQRNYLESLHPEQARGHLRPLSETEAARRLGIDKPAVNRLVKSSLVQTPRFGVVPLALFFAPAGRALKARTDVLALHIQNLLAAEGHGGPLTSAQIRMALEIQGLIPQSLTQRAKAHTERLIRRVIQKYRIPSHRRGRRRGGSNRG